MSDVTHEVVLGHLAARGLGFDHYGEMVAELHGGAPAGPKPAPVELTPGEKAAQWSRYLMWCDDTGRGK